ncbi:hypothetical protein TNCV_1290421 [Trichonephila clavipes]|nr:hypothetical protein TNCV_1290421 [Trichonephila clavipes]
MLDMRDKSCKETSSSKKSASGPDKISRCFASRTDIHPTTKLHSKNLDFHPVCLTRNSKNENDALGLRTLVPAPGLDDKDMHRTYVILAGIPVLRTGELKS